MKLLAALLICILFPVLAQAGLGDTLVQVSLKSDVATIAPGEVFHVGVLLKIEPGWHIYWKNPGDSGLATAVKLELPVGFTAGAVEYPYPKKIVLPGDITNYAYENETMLIVPVRAPKELPSDSAVTISAKVSWLVCKESCAPGRATVALDLPVSAKKLPANAELFGKWIARLPVERDPEHISDVATHLDLKSAATGLAGQGELLVHWKSDVKDVGWFPSPGQGVMVSDIHISENKNSTDITYHVDVSANAGNIPGIGGVVVYTIAGDTEMALTVSDHAR